MASDAFAKAMAGIVAQAGPPQKIVAALSGGMDSVVLLHLLVNWRDANGIDAGIVAAHLNHGLRGLDADLDQDFCRAYAEELGVAFTTRSEDAAAVARAGGMGVEEAGRLLRYRFFQELAHAPDSLVLTGHHADDQAETILMHLRRGAHRRGLSGMKDFTVLSVPPDLSVRVGRPLLALPRERLHVYALENGLDWREDTTNQDASYARNRIRHRVIPMLETLLPGFRDRLLEKAETMAREEAELSTRGRELVNELARRQAGGCFFLLSNEAFADPERLIYAFRHLIEEEMGNRLPYGAALSRLSQLAGSGKLGETLTLPGLLRVRRERDGLFFFYPETTEEERQNEFIFPDPPFSISIAGFSVTAEWLPSGGMPPESDRSDPEVEWLNPNGIRWPLCLRPPRPGERFRPLGAPGSRKIQDILVDLKTPRRLRGLPRVVADHAGAVWLWPYRLAERVRLNGSHTKALRLEIREI